MLTRPILCLLAGFAVAACEGVKYEEAEKMEPTAGEHGVALYEGYLGLSKAEYDEGDYRDSDYFARRAMRAGADQKVEPQLISARDLPVERLNEMAIARRQVITVLYRGAAQKMPKEAAIAQTSFDCWMQEQEEDFQEEDIAACRERLKISIARINAGLAPAATRNVSDDRLVYEVFFEFDSDALSPEAKEHLKAIAKITKTYQQPVVAVIGNADQVGATEYNLELSQRRADMVAKELEAAGVKLMGVFASGDQAPAVANPDRQPEQRNRRALIVVREAQQN